MTQTRDEGAPRRAAGRRDRRGRGPRGPAVAPDPAAPLRAPVPAARTRREEFDRVALDALDEVERRAGEVVGEVVVELAVEECPVLPTTWTSPRVPLATLVAPTASTPARLVLFRRPIEHRASEPGDLEALVLTVVVEQLADHLGMAAEDLHPDYEPPD